MNEKFVILVLTGLLAAVAAVVGIHYEELRAAKKNKIEVHLFKDNRVWENVYQIFAVLLLILMAVVFAVRYDQYTYIYVWKRMLITAGLMTAAFYDKKELRIPNFLIVALLICRIILLSAEFLSQRQIIVSTLLSEVVAAGAMGVLCLLCVIIMKGSMGMGDVKLLITMGVFEGLTGIFSAIFTSMILIFFAAVFLLITKKKGRKDALPFAPFLFVGTYVSILLTGN